MKKIIEIDKLTVHYGSICALRNASLTIYEKDFIGVIGPNGGGKSTFIKALIGLVPHTSGEIKFWNNEKECPSIKIGYLPQHSEIDRQFPISVTDVIHSGLSGEHTPWLRFRSDQRQQVEQMLCRMGLSDLGKRAISALSGGQLQRVLLGRALISEPKLLVLDEPTSYLDQGFEDQLYEILSQANKKTAILMVSHNIPSVQAIAKSLACINKTLHHHKSIDISPACIYETFFSPQLNSTLKNDGQL